MYKHVSISMIYTHTSHKSMLCLCVQLKNVYLDTPRSHKYSICLFATIEVSIIVVNFS